MYRPVIIVDPLDGGSALAPAFKQRGIPAIAVTMHNQSWNGFGSNICESDFIKIIPNQENIAALLRKHNPIAIIPGAEEGVDLAEKLTHILTPKYANDFSTSQHRQHKALMQEALVKAGIPSLKTLNSTSELETDNWIRENNFLNEPLIIKPPISSGSDKVFHISPGEDWRKAFDRILSEPTVITGEISKTVVVQEQAIGTEYAVGTVSVNGEHHLAHLIKYNKTSIMGRNTVFDYVEFVPFEQSIHGELLSFTKKTLDALGVKWGAAHNEIMLTEKGPRLIETGARICGGPVTRFAREATGSSQVDKLVEAYIDGNILSDDYVFKKSVVAVFLKAHSKGVISNLESVNNIKDLPTLLGKFIWTKNGDYVDQTVDYLTSIGIIALSGHKDNIFKDYRKIRELESNFIIRES